MVAVHHVTVTAHLDRVPAEFSDAGRDALLQLHQGEDIHEGGLVGVVGAEAHVHAQDPLSLLLQEAAPDALHAGGVIAVVVFPNLPRDGLGTAGVGGLGQLLAEDLHLVEGFQGRHLVFEQPLVVGVFPARVLRVFGIADQVVLDALADFHDIFLQLGRAAREILVDHRLAQRIGDRNDHRGVLAGRVFGLVVFGLEVAAALVEFDQGKLPGAGDAVTLYMQNRYAFHGCVCVVGWRAGASLMAARVVAAALELPAAGDLATKSCAAKTYFLVVISSVFRLYSADTFRSVVGRLPYVRGYFAGASACSVRGRFTKMVGRW